MIKAAPARLGGGGALWLCPCRRPVLPPQVCCAACLCCAQQPPVAGTSAAAAWQCLDTQINELTPEVNAAEKRWVAELTNKGLELIYINRVDQLNRLQTERAGLGSQLTAGWSCADALVRPSACAPACPCAHLPLRPPAQPCDAAL